MISRKDKGWTIELVGFALFIVALCFLWNEKIAVILFIIAGVVALTGALLRHFSPPFNDWFSYSSSGPFFLIQIIPRTDKELAAVCFSWFFLASLFSGMFLWMAIRYSEPLFMPAAVISELAGLVGMPLAWQWYYGRWQPWSRVVTKLLAVAIAAIIAWRLLVSIYR
jgi:hypothetical protein